MLIFRSLPDQMCRAAMFFFGVMIFSAASARSQSYIVVDANQKKVLLESNAEKRVPIASLTKVATALVSLDWIYSQNMDKNALMTVPPSIATMGGANPLSMQPGDQISMRDAMYAALMASDNASALTLADHLGRQMMARAGGRDPVGVFVGQMNALSGALGMAKTRFTNPHGLDHQGQTGLSTARDMARLMIYGLRNPSFNFIVAQSDREVTYIRAGQQMSFNIKNTNKILGQFGIDGGKTGSTQRAGDCLMTTARKPDKFVPIGNNQQRRIPYRLVTVVLGSPDRYNQTGNLIRQGWTSYDAWVASGMLVKKPEEILSIGN